jgi:hypothetical protein
MNKLFLSKLAGLTAVLSIASMPAMAAIDASVTTAMGEVGTDIATIGTLIIGLAVVALGIRWVKATFF